MYNTRIANCQNTVVQSDVTRIAEEEGTLIGEKGVKTVLKKQS